MVVCAPPCGLNYPTTGADSSSLHMFVNNEYKQIVSAIQRWLPRKWIGKRLKNIIHCKKFTIFDPLRQEKSETKKWSNLPQSPLP